MGKKGIKWLIIISLTVFVILILANLLRRRLIGDFNYAITHSITNTAILDSDGEPFYILGGYNNREDVASIGDISPAMVQAVMALEDTRFFNHFGIDPVRIVGALLHALSFKGYFEGASTITQQLIKNTVLTHEKSLSRKGKEILFALSIETVYKKDQIMLMYLNTAYFGNGYYGIEKAARGYFGISAKNLDIAQACMLAALIKKPEGYNPFKEDKGLADLSRRQKYCVYRQFQLGYITAEEAKKSDRQQLQLSKKPLDQSNFYEFYATWTIRQVEDILGKNFLKQEGLRVYTPLKRHIQNTVEAVLTDRLSALSKNREGAMIVIDYRNGNVVAMTGGKDFQKSQFNKATQARRQLGSSFKPFVYAAALEIGYKTDDMIEDSPVEFYSEDAEGNFSTYIPENYNLDYSGLMTLHDALVYSNNIISVKLLDQIKPPALFALTDRMNMPLQKEKGLCIALGCSEMTLEELTAGYQIFSAGGLFYRPNYILKITDMDGNVLYRPPPPQPIKVVSESTAERIRTILMSAVKIGTARAANPGRLEVGGKTGTTDDYRDAWFVGFTPDYTAGVWTGKEDNTPTDGEVGGGTPAIVWREFTQRLYNISRNSGQNPPD